MERMRDVPDDQNLPPVECWGCAIAEARHPEQIRQIGWALVEEYRAVHRALWVAGVIGAGD